MIFGKLLNLSGYVSSFVKQGKNRANKSTSESTSSSYVSIK